MQLKLNRINESLEDFLLGNTAVIIKGPKMVPCICLEKQLFSKVAHSNQNLQLIGSSYKGVSHKFQRLAKKKGFALLIRVPGA